MEMREQPISFEHPHLPTLAIVENFRCRRCWHTFPTEGLERKQCPVCGRLNRQGEDELMVAPVQRQ